MPEKFTIEIEREYDRRWIADVVEVPGVMAYGRTMKEAVENVLRILAEVADANMG